MNEWDRILDLLPAVGCPERKMLAALRREHEAALAVVAAARAIGGCLGDPTPYPIALGAALAAYDAVRKEGV